MTATGFEPYIQMLIHYTHKCSQYRSISWPVWLNDWVFVYELIGCGLKPVAFTSASDIAPVSSKAFLDIQATAEFKFTPKRRTCDMIRTHNQMHDTD